MNAAENRFRFTLRLIWSGVSSMPYRSKTLGNDEVVAQGNRKSVVNPERVLVLLNNAFAGQGTKWARLASHVAMGAGRCPILCLL